MLFLFPLCICFAQPSEAGSYYSLFKNMSRKELSKQCEPEAQMYLVKNGMRVLDVGGDDGKMILFLAFTCDTVDYYLEDLNPDDSVFAPKFMALARKTVNPAVHFGLHQITGGDSTIPAKSKYFDRIIVRETFHHFAYPAQMLREFKRLLAPGGSIVITEPADQKKFKGCKLIPAQKLIDMFTSAGFKYVSTQKVIKADFLVYTFVL
ncbi:MAG: methyltransferase protein [Bacteroidota bacterium]|nr:methyltransferase protein [Bacteroidota bacterium]